MKTKKLKILAVGLGILLLGANFSFAQEAGVAGSIEERRVTQEQFAVGLVRNMKLEGWLPTAALPGDCVDLLENLGIAPLKGWDKKASLKQEDYLVIMEKAYGKEGVVYKRAAAVEEKSIEVINQKWQESHGATGHWVALKDLLNDRTYFPNGAPQSPFGLKYEDRNEDHKVDPHFLPIISLVNLSEFLSSR